MMLMMVMMVMMVTMMDLLHDLHLLLGSTNSFLHACILASAKLKLENVFMNIRYLKTLSF